ncbi:30S ribosomal S17 [Micractinium conductrix]|uniref:Small ribosomal subunit protein uS17c n=1 Tax=Micractinium conductrix TaxID=554055 RepID=A0A2P6VGV1_9CHLO|nr:30S ribosomal S17 [Micractinium conductrix]|eukprot:PSC73298.1 30S ribosomal S17 [Micractinium conductrix]
MGDIFDGLDELGPPPAGLPWTDGGAATAAASRAGAALSSDDIELALAQAEQLLDAAGDEPAAGSGTQQPWHEQAHALARSPRQQHWPAWPQQQAATAGDPPRPPSAFSLGEAAMTLRLTLHEKELELLELRAQCGQLADHAEHSQRQLQAGLAQRDSRIAQLEAAAAASGREAAGLAERLAAYRGLSPEAAARLQTEAAAAGTAARKAEAAAADAERRQQEAARRLASGLATWERVQAEVQAENGRLAADVARQRRELEGLDQEKEVHRARAAMLESRGAALPAPPPEQPRAAAAAEAAELRQQLAAVLERLQGRDAVAKKYKEAVRSLKRRVAELEEQLAAARSAEAAASSQAQAGAVQAAAVLEQAERQAVESRQAAERQAGEVRQQNEQYATQLAQLEAQLKKAEFERAQWEWRAQDAEQRAVAAGDAADTSSAAAARLADRRAGAAESRAAELEAQAKAASLRVVQLEKALGMAPYKHRNVAQSAAPCRAGRTAAASSAMGDATLELRATLQAAFAERWDAALPDGQFWLGATNVPELVVPLLADPGPGPSGKNQEICCATFALQLTDTGGLPYEDKLRCWRPSPPMSFPPPAKRCASCVMPDDAPQHAEQEGVRLRLALARRTSLLDRLGRLVAGAGKADAANPEAAREQVLALALAGQFSQSINHPSVETDTSAILHPLNAHTEPLAEFGWGQPYSSSGARGEYSYADGSRGAAMLSSLDLFKFSDAAEAFHAAGGASLARIVARSPDYPDWLTEMVQHVVDTAEAVRHVVQHVKAHGDLMCTCCTRRAQRELPRGSQQRAQLTTCAYDYCQRDATEVPGGMKVCGGCRVVHYCSQECQVADWRPDMAALGSMLKSSAFSGSALQARAPSARPAAPAAFTVRASQSLQGKVVSTAQHKTAVVEVSTLQVHPVYQKRVRVTTKYQAHDEQQQCQVGDTVVLAPSRPLSKSKRFVVESIVQKAK